MLDPKYIRENLEVVKEGARKKRVTVDIDGWVVLDDERKNTQSILDEKRSEQNKISKEIGKLEGTEREEKIKSVGNLKSEVQELEEKQRENLEKWAEILHNIPNPPSPEMPEGKDDTENITIKKWGEIPEFNFEIKNHTELGESLDILDIQKAAEISGSRFYYLKGDAVLMQFALVNYVMETLGDENIIKKIISENNLNLKAKAFIPMIPPVMIRNEVQHSIHRVFGDQTYQFKEDGINLVASAEHAMAPYHMNEVLDEKQLPKRYIGYSTAFRKEAGTYGKDMGGILRTHQFDKLEMESFTSAESGMEEQKLIVALQEYIVQKLKIPYQLQQVCTGDTGKPDYQQFDIECWIPAQKTFRETHTSDYMTDFQMRGVKSFYRTEKGEKKLLHTNDATAIAIGRILIAIWENYQTENGEIIIPEVLRKWMGEREKISKPA